MECFNCNNTILNTSLQIADQKINSLKNYIQKKNKKNQKRLPFLRKDISYFMHKVENNTEFEKKKEEYYLNYLLPKYYIMDYYRQSKPDSTSCGMLVIKCN